MYAPFLMNDHWMTYELGYCPARYMAQYKVVLKFSIKCSIQELQYSKRRAWFHKICGTARFKWWHWCHKCYESQWHHISTFLPSYFWCSKKIIWNEPHHSTFRHRSNIGIHLNLIHIFGYFNTLFPEFCIPLLYLFTYRTQTVLSPAYMFYSLKEVMYLYNATYVSQNMYTKLQERHVKLVGKISFFLIRPQ